MLAARMGDLTMKALIYALCGLAVAVGFVLASPAPAQTAYDINRLNAAIQVCNSPMGAGQPECARLRAQAPGVGGGRAAGLMGMLGSVLTTAQAPSAPPAPAAPAVSPAAIQQAIAVCVQNANGAAAAIQACLSIAGGRPSPAAARDPFAIPPPSQVSAHP
jgi:hypothetical protein